MGYNEDLFRRVFTHIRALFRRVFTHIRAHPKAWNQGLYVGEGECGTTYCLAGWAAVLTQPTYALDDASTIFDLATSALGLTEGEGIELFERTSQITDIDELQALVTHVTGVTFDTPEA